jgi:hypothetical protein
LTVNENSMSSCSPPRAPKNATASPGGRLTSPSRIASPLRRPMNRRMSRSSSCGSWIAPSGIPVGSTRNGTASSRNPLSPCSSQKPAICASSSRTSGLATLRSGWCE